jgi:hypothetical protein
MVKTISEDGGQMYTGADQSCQTGIHSLCRRVSWKLFQPGRRRCGHELPPAIHLPQDRGAFSLISGYNFGGCRYHARERKMSRLKAKTVLPSDAQVPDPVAAQCLLPDCWFAFPAFFSSVHEAQQFLSRAFS